MKVIILRGFLTKIELGQHALLVMRKVKINFWIDAGMFFPFLASAVSGFWLWFFCQKDRE